VFGRAGSLKKYQYCCSVIDAQSSTARLFILFLLVSGLSDLILLCEHHMSNQTNHQNAPANFSRDIAMEQSAVSAVKHV